jgi:hypothetical protein
MPPGVYMTMRYEGGNGERALDLVDVSAATLASRAARGRRGARDPGRPQPAAPQSPRRGAAGCERGAARSRSGSGRWRAHQPGRSKERFGFLARPHGGRRLRTAPLRMHIRRHPGMQTNGAIPDRAPICRLPAGFDPPILQCSIVGRDDLFSGRRKTPPNRGDLRGAGACRARLTRRGLLKLWRIHSA